MLHGFLDQSRNVRRGILGETQLGTPVRNQSHAMTKSPSEEATPAASGGGQTGDDDLGDPDVLADVMADPEFLQQVHLKFWTYYF